MRTLWKGAISFGLVNIPVKMYTATENKEIHFRYLHAKCRNPITYQKRCPVCNQEVPPEEIVWGYEYEKGRYVILKEEDFQRIPGEGSRTIDILDFVDLREIDPVYFEKSYFLEPNAGGEKAYALLKRAMGATGKIAIARVVIRTKSALACLRLYGDVVMLETMFYPDEIRSPAGLAGVTGGPALHENEITMAVNLISNLSAPFEPAKYNDTYREQLMRMIQSKITDSEVVAPLPEPRGGKVVDLMEALQASLAATEKAPPPEAKPRRRRSSG
ncbi:MAG: Ku protein [Bacillota bacterium]|jgi:DNA end-binding protein Ku